MMDDRVTILVIDGDLADLSDPCTSVLRYCALTRDEAVDLAVRSMRQGYAVAAWMACAGDTEADNG